MHCLSLLEPVSNEAVMAFAEKNKLPEHIALEHKHPQEDYLKVSQVAPIFVVADGVTLNFKKLLADKVDYPDPSPAGEVARIFTEEVIKESEQKYHLFDEQRTKDVFRKANAKVKAYNDEVGESLISGNRTRFFAATGAFVVVRDRRAYWMSICDSYVTHFDKNMELKFSSTGNCHPYAVINGEERMAEHIETGVLDLEPGDRIFVYTDGFENYVKNPEFLDIFKNCTEPPRDEIAAFSHKMNQADPEKYGHERSLISVLV